MHEFSSSSWYLGYKYRLLFSNIQCIYKILIKLIDDMLKLKFVNYQTIYNTMMRYI